MEGHSISIKTNLFYPNKGILITVLSLLHSRDKDLLGPHIDPRQSHTPPYESPDEIYEPLAFVKITRYFIMGGEIVQAITNNE